MQNVEIIVKNAVEKKSTHLKRDLNVVVRLNITKFKSHRYSLFEPPVFMN